MSNQIFCNVSQELCDKIAELAGNKIIIDCGAGRGMFGSMYPGKVLSLDIEIPREPLSPILEIDCTHYCFPLNSIPLFIRPCHSGFVHQVISREEYKLREFIYISKPENVEVDLDGKDLLYTVDQYSDWTGDEGEHIYHIKLRTPPSTHKVLSGRIIHLADYMMSWSIENHHQEFKEEIELPLENRGIVVDGLLLRHMEHYTSDACDYMFFDWGGASIGNSMMDCICRYIIQDAVNYPSRVYIVTSSFTEFAMKEALEEFGTELPNVFVSIDKFCDWFLKNG